MKLRITQDNLARALSIVKPVVAQRSTLPVLQCVLLDAHSDAGLTVTASNLEITTQTSIGASVQESGAVAVPARLLTDFVAGLPSDWVELELVEHTMTLHLKCGRYEANIKGIDALEFPMLADVAGETITLPGGALRTLIERVSVAAARDQARPVLAGALWRQYGDGITLAAADGYRLAVDSTIDELDARHRDAVIPTATLLEVRRIAPDDGEVVATVGERSARFEIPRQQTAITTQLIDGQFPDYEQIIPKKHNTLVITPVAPLVQALKMAAIFSRDANNTVRMSITGDRLTLTAQSDDAGDNLSNLEAVVTGANIETAFNVRYFLDALAGIHSTEAVLEMRDAAQPILVRENADAKYRAVVMPVHMR